MFRLRTAVAAVALVVGLGSTSQAQMFNQGFGVGFGGGVPGGFQPGFGAVRPGFGAVQPFGVGGIYQPFGPGYYSSFYGPGYGVPYYPQYPGYYAPVPQTYNAMGSLIDSIETSTSRRGGWRLRP